jgi:hypothetical protein
MIVKENYEKFVKWMTEFDLKHPDGYLPEKDWFDRVQESHIDIRRFLGGLKKKETIKINAAQGAADKVSCDPIIDKIINLLPAKEQSLDQDYSGNITRDSLLYPTISYGSHNAIGTGKFLLGLLDYNADKIKLNNLVAQLGQKWAQAKTESTELEVMLTTRSKAFALLGHYGPDGDSCFRQSYENDRHKYILAQSKNTYVVLIKQNDDVVSRMWGFTSQDFKTFNTCNFYYKSKIQEGTIIEAMKQFMANIIGTDKLNHSFDNIGVNNGLYHNGYGNWTFTASNPVQHQTLDANTCGIAQACYCPGCDEQYDDDREDWAQIDGMLCCLSCQDSSYYCDYTGELTFSQIISVRDKHNVLINTSMDIIHQYFIKCEHCNKYIERNIEGKAYPHTCADGLISKETIGEVKTE